MFSIVAIIFLLIIWHLMTLGSPYLKLKYKTKDELESMSEGVSGAIVIYVFFAVISCVYWYRTVYISRRILLYRSADD